MSNNELTHHGVKGMKWGIRKRRQAPSVSKSDKTTTAKTVNSKANKPKRTNSFRDRPDNRRMSDAELKQRLSRLQMEKQYKDLTTSPRSKSFVKEILADSGKQAARQLASRAVNVGLQLAIEGAAKNTKNPSTKVFLTALADAGGGKKKKPGK